MMLLYMFSDGSASNNLEQMFDLFDDDNSGFVCADELKELMAYFMEIGEGRNHKASNLNLKGLVHLGPSLVQRDPPSYADVRGRVPGTLICTPGPSDVCRRTREGPRWTRTLNRFSLKWWCSSVFKEEDGKTALTGGGSLVPSLVRLGPSLVRRDPLTYAGVRGRVPDGLGP